MKKRVTKFFVSYYCFRFKERSIKLGFASDNYYSILLMLTLMYVKYVKQLCLAYVCAFDYLRLA